MSTVAVREHVLGAPGRPPNAEFEKPQPLRREMPPGDPYPIDALGAVLRGAADAIGRAIQSPDALRAQSLLAGAALAVQAHADISLDGRTFPLSQNFITIAESGERKSATDRAALVPHDKRQRDLQMDAAHDRAEYEADLAAWKKAKEQALGDKTNGTLEKKRDALLDLGPEPEPPLTPILTTDEPTYEGLVKALAIGWPSIGIFSDEGGRFLGGHAMNQDNVVKTATGLSGLWDGKPITRTRGGDGHMVLTGRRVSMHLMVQPGISSLLFGNRLLHAQGLLSRMLVAQPQSTIGSRPYECMNLMEADAMRRYFDRLQEILETLLPLAAGTRNELAPRRLDLVPAAKTDWIRFHDHIERLMRPDEALAPIKGLAAKAAEHALRLAGIVALVDDLHCSRLDTTHVSAGIELAQFYLNEALRLFNAAADDPDLALAEKCLAWMQAQPQRRFSIPDLYQRGPNAVRDKKTAERIVRVLEDHGWVWEIGAATINGQSRRCAWEAAA